MLLRSLPSSRFLHNTSCPPGHVALHPGFLPLHCSGLAPRLGGGSQYSWLFQSGRCRCRRLARPSGLAGVLPAQPALVLVHPRASVRPLAAKLEDPRIQPLPYRARQRRGINGVHSQTPSPSRSLELGAGPGEIPSGTLNPEIKKLSRLGRASNLLACVPHPVEMLGYTHPLPWFPLLLEEASSGLGFPIVSFSLAVMAKGDWVPGFFCTCLGLFPPGPGLGTALTSMGLPAVTQLGQEPAW